MDTLSNNKRLSNPHKHGTRGMVYTPKKRRGIITVNISSTNRGLNQHKRPPQIRQTNQRTY